MFVWRKNIIYIFVDIYTIYFYYCKAINIIHKPGSSSVLIYFIVISYLSYISTDEDPGSQIGRFAIIKSTWCISTKI